MTLPSSAPEQRITWWFRCACSRESLCQHAPSSKEVQAERGPEPEPLTLFVSSQHQRVFRRIEAQTNYVFYFLIE